MNYSYKLSFLKKKKKKKPNTHDTTWNVSWLLKLFRAVCTWDWHSEERVLFPINILSNIKHSIFIFLPLCGNPASYHTKLFISCLTPLMFNQKKQKNLKTLTVKTFSKMFRKLQTTSKSLIILPETRKCVKLGVNGDICWVQAAVSRGQCRITSPNVTLFFCARSFFFSLAVSCCKLVFHNLKKFL